MIKTADEIYNELRHISMQCTGNGVEALDTYVVKSKSVTLFIQRNESGNGFRYAIGVKDIELGLYSQVDVLFGYYPSKNVDHGTFLGTPAERVVVGNSGVFKNIYEILRAIGKLYNLPVERKHY